MFKQPGRRGIRELAPSRTYAHPALHWVPFSPRHEIRLACSGKAGSGMPTWPGGAIYAVLRPPVHSRPLFCRIFASRLVGRVCPCSLLLCHSASWSSWQLREVCYRIVTPVRRRRRIASLVARCRFMREGDDAFASLRLDLRPLSSLALNPCRPPKHRLLLPNIRFSQTACWKFDPWL